MKRETGDVRQETGDRRCETGDLIQETRDRRHETRDRRQETGEKSYGREFFENDGSVFLRREFFPLRARCRGGANTMARKF